MRCQAVFSEKDKLFCQSRSLPADTSGSLPKQVSGGWGPTAAGSWEGVPGVMAGVVSFELTARGFGDRCSTS